MKYAVFAAIVLISFSSCKKTYIDQTVNQAFSAIYTIDPSAWQQGTNSDQTIFYYVNLSVPELDDIINTHGGVEVYLSFDDPNATVKNYEALPEVFDGVAYGSLHTTGTVTIDLRGADGGSLSSPIGTTVTAKVVLIDAQPLDN